MAAIAYNNGNMHVFLNEYFHYYRSQLFGGDKSWA